MALQCRLVSPPACGACRSLAGSHQSSASLTTSTGQLSSRATLILQPSQFRRSHSRSHGRSIPPLWTPWPRTHCQFSTPRSRTAVATREHTSIESSPPDASGAPAAPLEASRISLSAAPDGIVGLLSLASAWPLTLGGADAALAEAIFQTADVSEGLGYSQASYYTSLGLFIISIPGLWSLIKRATKSKIVRRTFEVPGPAAVASRGGRSLAQLAGEITAFLKRSNYKVAETKDVVTFEGAIVPSKSQAAFLVFCTALSLASVALVLSITNPDVGEWWYSLIALSPLAGVYYWRKAARTEQIQVKIVVSDDEQTADVTMQGDDEEIERLRRELGLMEKGLEYVKGVFES